MTRKPFTHVKQAEFDTIRGLLDKGISQTKIAQFLNRSASLISLCQRCTTFKEYQTARREYALKKPTVKTVDQLPLTVTTVSTNADDIRHMAIMSVLSDILTELRKLNDQDCDHAGTRRTFFKF